MTDTTLQSQKASFRAISDAVGHVTNARLVVA